MYVCIYNFYKKKKTSFIVFGLPPFFALMAKAKQNLIFFIVV